MNAEIIAVGTELLLGDIVNTDAQYISQQLSKLGINVHFQTTVGDNKLRLRRALSDALSRSNIIITTGGLGPTGDDLTKETICEALNISMELHLPTKKRIQDFFDRIGKPVTENNIKQAMLPKDATVFENDFGTAPGCALQSGNQCIIMLPGPPRELIPMFETKVYPFLQRLSDGTIVSKNLRVFGMGEAAIEEKIKHLLDGENPTVALYAKDNEVLIRVTAKADTLLTALKMCQPPIDQIMHILGDVVYGIDVGSLEEVVVNKLRENKLQVGTAESCTGGLLSQKITNVPGSSDVFEFGISSYANRVKQEILGVSEYLLETFGAVSEEVAAAMAVGALRRSHANIGVGITGIAGPTGGNEYKPVGLVYISVATEETVWVKKVVLGHGNNERDYVRNGATLHALDMVRRVIDGLPIEDAVVLSPDQVNQKHPGEKTAKKGASAGSDRAVKQAPTTFKGKLIKFISSYLPWKGDGIREQIRKSIFLVAVISLICSSVYLLSYVYGSHQNKQLYDDLAGMIVEGDTSVPDGIKLPDGYLQKFALLYSKNKDIKGWITIGDTPINYPVVQSNDNDYYLKRDFYKKKNRHGVPFVDYRNNLLSLDTNTIIYGHNMRSDNQMFSELTNYSQGKNKLNYFRKNPVITFDSVYEEMQWKIVSVFITNTRPEHGEVFQYHNFINASSQEDFDWFVNQIKMRSLYNIPVDIQYGDKFLTLSTCTYEFDDARLVIVARKVREGESAEVDVNQVTLNANPLYPDIWYKKGLSNQSKPAVSTASTGGTTSFVTSYSSFPGASSNAGSSSSTSTSSGQSSISSSGSSSSGGFSSGSSSGSSSGQTSSSSSSTSSGGSSSDTSSAQQSSDLASSETSSSSTSSDIISSDIASSEVADSEEQHESTTHE